MQWRAWEMKSSDLPEGCTFAHMPFYLRHETTQKKSTASGALFYHMEDPY